MKLSVEEKGNYRRKLRAEREFIRKQAALATKEATNGLKKELRADIVGSGLGVRLSRTWRGEFYNDRKDTVKGFVYSRAPEIIESFDQGTLIRPRSGSKYLAIPTENALKFIGQGKGKKRKSGSPQNYMDKYGPDSLRFVKLRNGTRVLVGERGVRRSRETGEFKGFKKASQRALRTGVGLATVVMYILIPQAKMPKKLDVDKIADQWGVKHINLLQKRYT